MRHRRVNPRRVNQGPRLSHVKLCGSIRLKGPDNVRDSGHTSLDLGLGALDFGVAVRTVVQKEGLKVLKHQG